MCVVPDSRTSAAAVMVGEHSVPVMSPPATPFAFSKQTTTPQLSAAAMPAAPVVVRSVWAHNLKEEVELIESLLPSFPYLAVDTEFPGTVHRAAVPAYVLTPEMKYSFLKQNVDELHLIQLGLTLFDPAGRLPGGAQQCVWEFNFREFDMANGEHRYAPESIAMLRGTGVDFGRTRREGVSAAAFGPRFLKWLRGGGLGRAGVVTFSGAYDLAYLVKMAFGHGFRLPATAAEFEGVIKAMFRQKRVFDVKEMAARCPVDLRGGLESVARKLAVPRVVGEAHQAGSDSLLVGQVFLRMRERYFDDAALAALAGVVTGITAH